MVYLKDSKITVKGPHQIARVFRDLLALEDEVDRAKEHYYVMHLDIRSRVKLVELVSLGSLSSSVAHPRETFRRAVIQGSESIIIAHNHPSGEPDPSANDIKVTEVMLEAGQVLGITMLDHIVFTNTNFYSFKDAEIENMEEGGEQL